MEFDLELPHEACQKRERNLCSDKSGPVFSLTLCAFWKSYVVHSISLHHMAELHLGRSGLNVQLRVIAMSKCHQYWLTCIMASWGYLKTTHVYRILGCFLDQTLKGVHSLLLYTLAKGIRIPPLLFRRWWFCFGDSVLLSYNGRNIVVPHSKEINQWVLAHVQ